MTIRNSTTATGGGRYRSPGAQLPHVGEFRRACLHALRMVEQRDGGRVSAPGDEG